MSTKQFKDKVIVITGATGGVGCVTAWEFAKQGAKIPALRSVSEVEGRSCH